MATTGEPERDETNAFMYCDHCCKKPMRAQDEFCSDECRDAAKAAEKVSR